MEQCRWFSTEYFISITYHALQVDTFALLLGLSLLLVVALHSAEKRGTIIR